MATVTIHKAKTHLSRLIERACAGEDIIIARGPTPVVRLSPVIRPPVRREFGAMQDRVAFDESFFDPLPDDELDAWSQ